MPSYIGDSSPQAKLDFTFSFDNPLVDCSGVLTFYRLPFVLVNPKQSSEQIIGNYIQTANNVGSVAINPVSTSRVTQAIQNSNRAIQIAAGEAPDVTLQDVARNFGIADEALATEFAETFTIRETSAIGPVQVATDNIIEIGLPFLPPAAAPVPATDELEEEGEEETAEEETPADGQPLAAADTNDDTIGPLSLLTN